MKSLKEIAEKYVNKTDFVAQRARGACIAVVGRPDLKFGFAHASHIVTPDAIAARASSMHIKRSKEIHEFCLRFVPIDK